MCDTIGNPNIRYARESDVAVIRTIMDLSVENLPQRDWFIDDDENYIREHIKENGYTLIYMCGEEAAGYLIVHVPLLSEGNLGRTLGFDEEKLLHVHHLESACVHPAFRGKGIQSALIGEAMRREMADSSVWFILSTVHPDNIYSKRNIEKAGLREAKRIVEKENWPRLVMMYEKPR